MYAFRKLSRATLCLLMVFTVAVATTTSTHAAGNWQPYGNGTGDISPANINYPQLAVSRNGVPYIAYIDPGSNLFDSADDTLVVKRFNGSNWESVGGSTVPGAKPGTLDLLVSSSGQPYVAYMDYDHSYKLSVQRFNGSSWEFVGNPGFSLGEPDGDSFAFDSNNNLFVAYGNITLPDYTEKPVVQHFNGSSWDVVGSADISGPQPSVYVKLAVDNNNVPYIGYADHADYSGELLIKRFNGTGWEAVGNSSGISDGASLVGSLAVSRDNIPYVSYSDFAHSSKVIVQRFDGTNWQTVGPQGISNGTAFESQLHFTTQNIPYVSFQETSDNKMYVERFNGSSWDVVGSDTVSPNGAYVPSMTLDARNIPYVIYGDRGNDYKVTVQRFIDGPDQLSDPATTTIRNAENGGNIQINSGFGTTLTCSTSRQESSLPAQDTRYAYLNGLVHFCFNTDFTNNQVTVIFDSNQQPSQVVARKYSSSGGYTTINNATITKTSLNGSPALAVTYTVADNGPLDDNPAVGAITDPIGLATVIGAPNTGNAKSPHQPSAALLLILTATIWTVAAGIRRFVE